ncbi:PilZ domain-containing protein [Novosphingobium sp. FSW06-99]|uniref:PilZ domain-containing protein n=1 Tax=Novosphingobium sp. FSW06-99 TaxID=1739113 RepID=UPI00076CF926|nr:PilZ domain-containing protein [Novosphingobium sp. FSW06-99]KUR78217.1 hypothetical protein AQZ49_07745 [Novosphingobium sp. FSW06-99]
MERKRNIQPETEHRRNQPRAWRASALPAEPERRIGPRHEIATDANATPVRLVDLSINGCCIGFTTATDFRPGQFIRLGFPGESDVVRAIVRWTEGLRIGAEFTRSLPSERIEAILGQDRNPLVGLL